MNRTFTYCIDQMSAGMTVTEYLKTEGYSRSLLIQLKQDENGIFVNGSWQRCNYILQAGDCLQTLVRDANSSQKIPPVPMNLNILFEDEDILVLNKPYDTPIHPSLNNYENSLANGVQYYFEQKKEHFVFRCINRLDRDTTGLTIIAKNALAACILSEMVKKRQISREYRCIADGILTGSGTICVPIGRTQDSLIAREVDFVRGETAITHFQVLHTFSDYSYVSLHLETGRTHQIRVHMSYLGHPLLGDFLYHPDYPLADTHADKPIITRQALHAYRLQFLHPITKKPMDFIADIPDDMQHLLSC